MTLFFELVYLSAVDSVFFTVNVRGSCPWESDFRWKQNVGKCLKTLKVKSLLSDNDDEHQIDERILMDLKQMVAC